MDIPWFGWAAALLFQSFTITLAQRARNSNSLFYGTWASGLMNIAWFICQVFMFSGLSEIIRTGDKVLLVKMGLFTTIMMMLGSTASQALCLFYLEKKNDKRSK